MNNDHEEATEIANLLMRNARQGGPIEAVRNMNRVLRILRIVIRVITHERNKSAYALTCYRSHRRVAERVGVSSSTMQRWMEAGSPNGKAPVDDAADDEFNDDE